MICYKDLEKFLLPKNGEKKGRHFPVIEVTPTNY